MGTISALIIIVVIVVALAINVFWNISLANLKAQLDRRSDSLAKREASLREAMRQNGSARASILAREKALTAKSTTVVKSCILSDAEVEKCKSGAKCKALAKGRLAHNIGYAALQFLGDPVEEWVEGGRVRYSYKVIIAKEEAL